jgi:hypothetical protein
LIHAPGYYNRLDLTSEESDLDDEEIDSDEYGQSSSDQDDDGDALTGGRGKLPWAKRYNGEIETSSEDSDVSDSDLRGVLGSADDDDEFSSSEGDSLDSAEEEAMLQKLNARLIQLNNMPDDELEKTIQEYMSKYPSDSDSDDDDDSDLDLDGMH